MSRSKKWARRRGPAIWPVLVLGLAILAAGWLLNGSRFATLDAQASDALLSLRINEVQNNNELTLLDADGDAPAWVELENTGDEPLSLRGVCLMRDSRVNQTCVLPDITLEPGAFALVYADGKRVADGSLHAPFRLPKSGAHALYLFDAAQRLLDEVSLSPTQADESLCRDEAGEWVVTPVPTPGRQNALSGERVSGDSAELGFNEFMTDNRALFVDENGEAHDYLEIVNRAGRDIDLGGYWLSDNPEKPRKWRFPEVTLPAGGVLAVHCSGLDRADDPAHLHASFRLSEGETVTLSQPSGVLVASMALPALEAGQALSKSWDGQWVTTLPPTPNRENTEEAAMQIDAEGRDARAGGVYISEVAAAPGGGNSDWVELYNDSDREVDISGWGLSDRIGRARKWQFPDGTHIDAHGCLAVFMLGEGESAPEGYLSAPFALSRDGGYTVSLCDPSGAVLDALFLPRQYSGITYGRNSAGECGYFAESTPLAVSDAAPRMGPPEAARCSVKGGLFAKGERLSVELAAEPGARVYYTLDCTDPDERSTLYDGTPIEISSTTVLRTRVFMDGHAPSLMDAQSYLFDVQAASDAKYVVSLVSDPDNLYSEDRGIMVKGPNATDKFPYGDYNKGANFWMDWKREAHVEVFTGAGETAISQECDIKLHGRNTRAYELKCFKVMADADYGAGMFDYPIFSNRPYDTYEAFILRYSGQDYKYTFMRDVIMSRLAANTSVMYMEAEECICYLNGKYYSAMYIRENVSPFSIARREGWEGQEDALDLVKSSLDVKQGSNETYVALTDYLRSHDNNTQEAYDRFAAVVDIDNFIDYMTMQVVYCPPDTVNVKRYRNPQGDGKWRWVIYDLDRALRSSTNGFKVMAQGTNSWLFRAVMKNDALRDRFLTRLNEALSTYLSSQSMDDAVMAQFARIKPLLPQYLDKVGMTERDYAGKLKDLRNNIAGRPKSVLKQCASYMKLSDDEMQRRFAETIAQIKAFSDMKTDR